MIIESIQQELRSAGLDGWLFVDHHQRDPLAYRILGLRARGHVSRRWFYFIPATGSPMGLVHQVEPAALDALPGEKLRYMRWQEQEAGLRRILQGSGKVAMQYSLRGAIAYVANVDAGTVELVRSMGVEVVSSAELVQLFEARWTPAMLERHFEAGRHVDEIRREAFDYIRRMTRADKPLTEYDVQQFVMQRFSEAGMVTNCGPIVAVNAHSSDSHYSPPAEGSSIIRRGDLVLLDLWAKMDADDGVYYDSTWMAYCGNVPPARMVAVFEVVMGARDVGIELVNQAMAAGRTIRGCDVDDAVFAFIDSHGHGNHVKHRTGHSLGREVHGVGANIDNTETHDDRAIIPRTCFTIEPCIYLPEFGMRSEINVYVDERGVRVTGELQKQLTLL
jgi:Xaa-Pro aminopeptidase